MPRGLPSVGANRQGGLALLLRDRQKHFTRYGYNERDNHDREHDTRGEITHTIKRALEHGQETEHGSQRRNDTGLKDGHQHVHPQKTKNDAGDSGQKLDQKCEGV